MPHSRSISRSHRSKGAITSFAASIAVAPGSATGCGKYSNPTLLRICPRYSYSPSRSFKKVVFPRPFLPVKPRRQSVSIRKLTDSKTSSGLPSYPKVRSCISIIDISFPDTPSAKKARRRKNSCGVPSVWPRENLLPGSDTKKRRGRVLLQARQKRTALSLFKDPFRSIFAFVLQDYSFTRSTPFFSGFFHCTGTGRLCQSLPLIASQ